MIADDYNEEIMKDITKDEKESSLFLKILENTRSSKLDYYLICNSDAIKKALSINVSKKTIYKTIIEEGNFKISYSNFIRKIKNIDNYSMNTKTIQNGDNNNTGNEEFKTNIIKNNPEPKIIGSNNKKFQYDNNKY